MQSAVDSYRLDAGSVFRGEIVDLPYHALQKLSIMLLGLNAYAIKLPSIILGTILGLLLILLLNRWFKSNVALIASILTILSNSFLYLAGSGTPLIMLVFWPTLLLWLGSKIQGVTKPKPFYCFIFAFALLAAIFTPHIIYLAAFIVFFAIVHPHLRFTIKTLPTIPLILTIFIILLGLSTMVVAAFISPVIISELLLAPGLTFGQFLENIRIAFLPLFSWNTTLESNFLSPLIGLASVALAVIGILSTAKGFFASRNSIAICLIIFTVFLAGLNPESAILILLPMAILIAHGLRYILDKWYDLFPDNPYARIAAVFPVGIFLGIVIISGVSHFIFGYRYIPTVADRFNNDVSLLVNQVEAGTTIYVINRPVEYEFFKILESSKNLYSVQDELPTDNNYPTNFATLGKQTVPGQITKIITSPKLENSDRLYLYNNIAEESET